ncbi:hypothetical protein [Brevibacillus laterosporus]|uniref:hypothetical protein n=2 Tax=Brevibacillus laterosporus TaxID=1465 RepID=UPI001110B012|nr:hypothetical protein [Brevibacillus laterosporus]
MAKLTGARKTVGGCVVVSITLTNVKGWAPARIGMDHCGFCLTSNCLEREKGAHMVWFRFAVMVPKLR